MHLKENFAALRPFLGFGDFADVYLEESAQLALRWEAGKIDAVTSAEDAGIGLRFLSGGETRYGYLDAGRPVTEAIAHRESERLGSLVERLTPGLTRRDVPAAINPSTARHTIVKPPEGFSLDDKLGILKRAFGAVPKDPRIRQVAINYGERLKKVAYANTDGDSFYEERTYLVYSLTVTAEENGNVQNAYESLGGLLGFELFDGDKVERIAADVARRALLKLAAPPAPAGEMPVIIASSAGGTLIHEAVGHSLEADAVLEGTSPAYRGKVGTVVANEKLNVWDNPTVPGARGSFAYDDEGTKSEGSHVIENGVLKDLLYDRVSARKAGRRSNGHGRRESYAHVPIPRMSNTYVAPGPDDPAEVLLSVPNGFLVTKMGGGQVNTANGDFVFEVEEGYRLTDGKRTLVRGATLLGNGPQVLKDIDLVGSDHGWAIGTCGKEGQGVPVSDALPTVRIKKMVIGGGQ
jgi:TldD protein